MEVRDRGRYLLLFTGGGQRRGVRRIRGDFNVYALSASTGALLWKYTTGFRVEFFSDGGQWRGVRRV